MIRLHVWSFKKSLKKTITPMTRHCRILGVPAPAERERKFFWAAIHTVVQGG
jgi:hypothetical protein